MSSEIRARAVADEGRWRRRSLWLDTLGEPLVPRPALEGSVDCDVAVVGGGFVGLWTAYSLVRADPSLRVVLVEAEIAGYGAAGRNAGFVSAGIAGEARVYRRRGGDVGVVRAERAMIDAVDEVGRVVAEEGIDCGWVKGGLLRVATSRPQSSGFAVGWRRGGRGASARRTCGCFASRRSPGGCESPACWAARSRRTVPACIPGGSCAAWRGSARGGECGSSSAARPGRSPVGG